MISVYELAALAAATCWAFAAIVSAGPSQKLGAFVFNRLRMVMVFVMLALYAWVAGSWSTINVENLPVLVLSGLIGIFVGDTALFLTLNRLGPRRTGVLFSLNAPIATCLAWWFLSEELNRLALLGIAFVMTGVILAIIYGKRRDQVHKFEQVRGSLSVGIMLGLVAALCQASASFMVRPIMESGADPIAASAVRVGVASLGLTLLLLLPIKQIKSQARITFRDVRLTAFSGILGMGVGMTLILFALIGGEVGIISTLSATTPAIVLPILWLQTKERPAAGAWFGAFLVIVGTAMIFV